MVLSLQQAGGRIFKIKGKDWHNLLSWHTLVLISEENKKEGMVVLDLTKTKVKKKQLPISCCKSNLVNDALFRQLYPSEWKISSGYEINIISKPCDKIQISNKYFIDSLKMLVNIGLFSSNTIPIQYWTTDLQYNTIPMPI